ncbi:4-alpha-glucanotransferase [Arcanobacterium pluranimalium]|uniref:4-alpha-glucanotransferase n=1 Tax=Arcanobacterium pluranimalium TaxID=108028 RepID=UPI00195C1C6D|nr:4-alpha-glucanotransferase [Arcanobacterium pluranimalium]MBM7825720.1 4-alpha-glucanotransferase [Arcanobacterium pluranimalium]
MVSFIHNRELLVQLAHAYGVATEFWGYDGNLRHVADHTLIAVLESMGVHNLGDTTIETELERRRNREWYTVLPACSVVRNDRSTPIHVHIPHGSQVRLELALEDGGRLALNQGEDFTPPREINGVLTGQATFYVPEGTQLGYHRLLAFVESGGGEASEYEASLIVTPNRLPDGKRAWGRSWGMMAQLYSVRSRRSWGIGDLDDLAEMSSTFGDLGADFLLINPLHAAEVVGDMSPSPYLPATRRFFNPIYIRPENIAEVAYMSAPQRSLITWAGEEIKKSSLENELIDRNKVWEAKREALEVIFQVERSEARQRSFERFRQLEGEGLENFALWCAINEAYDGVIPERLRDISSPFVAQERLRLSERVDFWAWLQWIMDEQLRAAQFTAKSAGMEYGICHDLAVGVHPMGADTWTIPHAFAKNVGVGAPPDMYNQQGQNWHQPPWQPTELEAMEYAPLRDMIRTVLRHAGALRIDHIMGLFRLWWIPAGNSPVDGTYVQFDHEAMVGILLLEAYRSGAIIIGEDLGTVEPWVRDYLTERGILGTSVFWFEKQDDGYPKQASDYRRDVLVTVNTHDLPPAAGYLAEEHVDLRARLGLLEESEELTRQEARRERAQVLNLLQDYQLLNVDGSEREIVEALHGYIAQTPAVLLGISLTDAVGERRAQNQPGTDREYPNWKIPLADGTEKVVLVEELSTNPRLISLVQSFKNNLGH